MKKKLWVLGLSLCGVMALSSCAIAPGASGSNQSGNSESVGTSESITETKSYNVTFKQVGCPDVELSVEEGESIAETAIPMPVAKTGYTVVWEEKDLTNVKADIVVNAIITANDYTITYDVNGGVLEKTTQTVTYDDAYTLATPTKEGFTFVAWKKADGSSLTATGVWQIADNVTLTAEWLENTPETVTITFVQNGQQNVVKTINKGSDLTDIPTPVAKTGYTIVWETTEFTNVQESITVNAKETANTYTIIYDVSGGNALAENTQTVTYNAAYSLKDAPTRSGYKFLGWYIKGTNTKFENGTWTIDDNVELEAKWEKETNDDANWTKNY